jgi:NAD(P)-dependent dehydrogenase (short-subunit alcohol dehydrogenase family)
VHLTKTLAVQLGQFGITVNCIHPAQTRTERTAGQLAARAEELGITPEEVESRDYAPDSARGNSICRIVDAAEIAYVTAFLVEQSLGHHRRARSSQRRRRPAGVLLIGRPIRLWWWQVSEAGLCTPH